MDSNILSGVIYAVLGALVEAKKTGGLLGGIPNGHLYTAFMEKVDLREWTGIVGILQGGGMIAQSNYLLTVTPKGEALYEKLDAVIKAHMAKQ